MKYMSSSVRVIIVAKNVLESIMINHKHNKQTYKIINGKLGPATRYNYQTLSEVLGAWL